MTARTSAMGDRRGFTLVEILVVMTLLGLIAVALFGGLRFGARAWESGNARSAAFSEIEIGQSLLRRLLEQSLSLEDEEGDATFAGRQDSLRFTAPAPAQFSLGGIYLFELVSEPDEEHEKLVLRWELYRTENLEDPFQDEETSDQRTLIHNVEAVRFGYYGTPEEGREDARWFDDWEEAELLPSLVSIKLEMAEADPRHWPELQVAPKSGFGAVFQ